MSIVVIGAIAQMNVAWAEQSKALIDSAGMKRINISAQIPLERFPDGVVTDEDLKQVISDTLKEKGITLDEQSQILTHEETNHVDLTFLNSLVRTVDSAEESPKPVNLDEHIK